MPAGPRFLYYGLGLTNRQLFKIVDPTPHILKEDEDDDEDTYLDWSYKEALDAFFEEEGFQEDFVVYGLNLSKDEKDLDKVACIYGFKLLEFEIFDEWEDSLDTSHCHE